MTNQELARAKVYTMNKLEREEREERGHALITMHNNAQEEHSPRLREALAKCKIDLSSRK